MDEYVITDGNRFIYRNSIGKMVPAPTEMMADKFSKEKAENIIRTLPKALRKVFYIKKVDVPTTPKPPTLVKQVSKRELRNNTPKMAESEKILYWIRKLESMNGLQRDACDRKDVLLDELKEADRKVSDCLHYIEFSNLNAAQGYEAYRRIKNAVLQRRVVKNEIVILDIIISNTKQNSVLANVNETIKKMDERTYTPRICRELFALHEE